MVAYSFQKRFAGAVEDGSKPHTIRADRKRHAMVGERLQLYCGMRTKNCFKIIEDPICQRVHDISIVVGERRFVAIFVRRPLCLHGIERVEIEPELFDQFAVSDGFRDAQDMHEFWQASHGAGIFRGKLIGWGRWPLDEVTLP